ncbi:sensor histidine kinase KdpD [Streptomyces sp. NBC_00572]|uniref:sensor histidine kinase n=1 Tax=Streptomyces sp. NBC_00572 TaxID=2903664 RepID=UPI0022570691|nr:HAMP domain-containing sensor histidine kinase [Streptomyces sp. NBC_00572]MCX4985045.1 HAMP domain-containing histidine kinase [Streptomyces sp. NBC_00572]
MRPAFLRRSSSASSSLTPTARVLRLRRRISLLFALTSAVGLIAMAALAVRSDSARWREQLDHSMDVDTSWALGLLETDENGLLATDVLADTMNTDCPPLTVLLVTAEGGSDPTDPTSPTGPGDTGGLTVQHAPAAPCLTVSPDVVLEAGRAAARDGEARGFDRRTTNGEPVRVFALPFYPPEAAEGEGPQGVLVTLTDARAQRDDHRRLVWVVTGGCAVLVLLSAAVGHVLSGRAVRPALTVLGQQEAFLADAAHDLRTPAASLRTLAETALRGETDSTDVHRRTLRLAEGMGRLVDGLLTRARLMSGTATVTRQPLRLDQLVEAVVDEAPAEGHRVRVEAEDTVVVADPDLVRRAVGNLLGNALTHGHAPGVPADVRITVTRDGTLTVEDAGPGLPPEVANALFERFRSGSGSTGLGLSIASWVAHAHGGTLTAGPGEAGGARFVLTLPTPD